MVLKTHKIIIGIALLILLPIFWTGLYFGYLLFQLPSLVFAEANEKIIWIIPKHYQPTGLPSLDDLFLLTYDDFPKEFIDATIIANSANGSSLTQNIVSQVTYLDKKPLNTFLFVKKIDFFLEEEDIFELFANQADYGNNVDGMGMASLYYFKKLPFELDIVESIILASITEYPDKYAPDLENYSNEENWRARSLYLLEEMYKQESGDNYADNKGYQELKSKIESYSFKPCESEVFYGREVCIDSAEYYWELGFNAYSIQHNEQLGKQHYEKALEIDPDFVPALSSLGFIYGVFDNRFEEGKAMIERAMELDSTWAYAPFNLGLMLDINGQQEEGVKWIEYAIDTFPNHPDIGHFEHMLEVAKKSNF